MAETPIVSNTLQKTFRDNFPSQISSGRDLHVSDTIVPIVDFSSTVSVTGLSNSLQESLAFGNQNTFSVSNNNTTTVINTTGFYRVKGVGNMIQGNNAGEISHIISDGSTDKTIWSMLAITGLAGNPLHILDFDYNVFLRAGDSFKITCTAGSSVAVKCVGSYRQLADISGTLVNPTGYTGS